MKIIDTHAHYDDSWFDEDRYELLDRILSENVLAIVNMSVDLPTCEFTLSLCERYENAFGAVGIHPENVNSITDGYLDKLREYAKNGKVKAIGEIGLDYHYEGYDRELQMKVFKELLELANELSLPAVIHCRDALEDTMSILKSVKPEKAVMHCFSGSAETAAELLKMGLFISFTGVLTFKNAKKSVRACEEIPLSRLMLETDCPYMAPAPFRGSRCDSSMTVYTAERLAQIKNISLQEAIEACNNNAVSFFGLTV